ncbi:MAG TPA: hypothetical protein ENH82_11215 [bacterium]|nr:hypothetical protein [bacterium]
MLDKLQPHHRKMARLRVLEDVANEELLIEFDNHFSCIESVRNVMNDDLMQEYMEILADREFERTANRLDKAKEKVYQTLEGNIDKLIELTNITDACPVCKGSGKFNKHQCPRCKGTGGYVSVSAGNLRVKALFGLCAMGGLNVKGTTKADDDIKTNKLSIIECSKPQFQKKEVS